MKEFDRRAALGQEGLGHGQRRGTGLRSAQKQPKMKTVHLTRNQRPDGACAAICNQAHAKCSEGANAPPQQHSPSA
jgi:hypothetical protein